MDVNLDDPLLARLPNHPLDLLARQPELGGDLGLGPILEVVTRADPREKRELSLLPIVLRGREESLSSGFPLDDDGIATNLSSGGLSAGRVYSESRANASPHPPLPGLSQLRKGQRPPSWTGRTAPSTLLADP